MISSTQAVDYIKEANEVLNSESSSSTSKPETTSYNTHWSYKLQIGGALVGLVVAIAAAILQNTPLLLVSVALTLTNGIGAYYNKRFTILTSLGKFVNQLTLRIKEVNKQLVSLKQINSSLNITNATLNQNITKEKEVFEKEKTALELKTKEFENVTESLKATEKKLETLSFLYKKLKTTTEHFTENMQHFLQQGGHFEGAGIDFSNAVHRFDLENDELREMAKELDSKNDEYVEQNKQLSQIVEAFKAQLLFMEKNSKEVSKEKEELQKKVEMLSKTIEKIKSSTQTIEEIQKKGEKRDDSLNQIIRDLDDLKNLKNLIHIMTGVLTKEQMQLIATQLKPSTL